MAGVAYGSLPFAEQIAFFRAKSNVLTERWTDLWQEMHDFCFMVAGANRIDLLLDLRAAVDKAIADGATLAQFRRDFDAIVEKYGWQYTGGRNWRTRVIFETNLRTSYAAGRWAQLQRLKKWRPYWRYVHSDAVAHPRPLHLAWNGLVLHADDPWWHTHFPPNGWGCQCTVEALDDYDLEQTGRHTPDTAPPDDMQDVTIGQHGPNPQIVQTPAGVDPGFGYAPGRRAWLERMAQRVVADAARLPQEIADQALGPLRDIPEVGQALGAAMPEALTPQTQIALWWRRPQGDLIVAHLPDALVRALNAQSNAAVLTSYFHKKQSVRHPDIGAEIYAQLPAWLQAPAVAVRQGRDDVLIVERANRTLIVVLRTDRRGRILLRSVHYIRAAQLEALKALEAIFGGWG